MSPKDAREWVRIGRDVLIALVATFTIIWEEVGVSKPNGLIIGAGLTLFGLPAAFRLDQFFAGKDAQEDPFEGPGGYYRSHERKR